jgi:hypothetical protein
MEDGSPGGYITSGPRWDHMLNGIGESIAIIKKHGRGQSGWIKAMLDSYESVLTELNEGGHVRPGQIVGWARGEAWDPKKGGWESDSLIGDNAIADVCDAQEALQASETIRRFFGDPIPDEERSKGWTTALVAELSDALGGISTRLRAGEYLQPCDWRAWDNPLREAGVVRRVLTGISYVDRERDRVGMNIDFIESCPGGSWWERVREIDSRLVNFAGMEFSDHRVR